MNNGMVMRVNFEPHASGITLDIEDEFLTSLLASLYDTCELSKTYAAESHVIAGNVIEGFSFGSATALLSLEKTLGLIDSIIDKHLWASRTDTLVAAHSCGLIAPKNGAVAIVGQTYFGKTTLGLACAKSGIPLLGDEYGWLDLDSAAYSHTPYPLCARESAIDLLGLRVRGKCQQIDTPLGATSILMAFDALDDVKVHRGSDRQLKAIIIPDRSTGKQKCIRQLPIRDWPQKLLPSIDAALPRDALFRKLVHLFSKKRVSVFEACYSDIDMGVTIVQEVINRIAKAS